MKGNLKKSITRPKYEIVEVGSTEITADVSMLAKSSALYFNATLIAKYFDKDLQSFIRSEETLQYIQMMVKDSKTVFKTELDCIKTRRGKYGGTWLHNGLALRFARWCSVSFEYQLDGWIKQRMDDERQRQLARDAARTGYLPMTNAIKSAHNPAKHFHYSNEADLLNRIVLGMSSKQFKLKNAVDSVRDACDAWQVYMLDKLQRIDTSLIEIGMCSHDRKQQLQRLFDTEARAAVGAGEYDGLGAKHATSI